MPQLPPYHALLARLGVKLASSEHTLGPVAPHDATPAQADEHRRRYLHQARTQLAAAGISTPTTHAIPVDPCDVLRVDGDDDGDGIPNEYDLTEVLAYPVEPEDGLEEE